ncbi:MrcB family domain-containing protein [Nocardia sp. CA-107356]|uniref:MrcB family domain-containing protein n=1 Tax=Nocardia sp. CA-107356 TaxID=3239972 RepID=UPI003D8D10F8
MSLRDLLEEVLTLQPNFSADAQDPVMVRRKALVEKAIPEWIQTELNSNFPKWQTEGSGGKGTPARVPWSRYFDPQRSGKPGGGWYAVYLFSATGDAVYLSLNQGTSPFDPIRRRIISLSDSIVIRRADWARSALASDGVDPTSFGAIDLHMSRGLGHAYELGNVHGIGYQADSLPTEEQLRQDFSTIGEMLDKLYKLADDTVFIPGDEPPEIVDAEKAAAESAGKTRRTGGQHQRLSHADKVAIEEHAVDLAIEHFKAMKYTVKNTGDLESYDLLATRGAERIYVEVKGTTSLGGQVILTYNEVEHHRQEYPNNALVVVHSIKLDRTPVPPRASGGAIVVHQPWQIDQAMLRPVSYYYTVPNV